MPAERTMMNNSTNRNLLFRIFILMIVLIACQTVTFGQEGRLIVPKKLEKDFGRFRTVLTAHPDPFAHVSKEELLAKLDSVQATLDVPHSQLEFYKKLSALMALLKDGHSSLGLPEFLMEKNRKAFGCFPYELHLTNTNELFVLKNFNQGDMEPSSRILAINGISVDSFLNRIDPYISYEKLNFRNTIIDNDFEKYLYLAFNTASDLTFKYFLKDTMETVVQSMPIREWRQFQRTDREEGELLLYQGKPYAYEKVKEGIGKLSIYGFFAKDLNAYNHFLLRTFKTIRKDSIQSLIIDIRGNYGGWPKIASELFHYISDNYFKTMAKSSILVSRTYQNYFYELYPSLRVSRSAIPKRRHFVDIPAIIDGDVGTFIHEGNYFNEEPISESSEFEGDVYLLTNRDSYSAASSFASTFQCYNMGLIIGEETGGTKIFRANAITFELASSGISASISTTKMYTACYSDELEGVMPNVPYSPSIFELLSDMDTQLIYALRVIKKVEEKRKAQLEVSPK